MQFKPGSNGTILATRIWNGSEELLGCIELVRDEWVLTFLAGNAIGTARRYYRLEEAVARLKDFTPYSNEGMERSNAPLSRVGS